MNPLDGPFSQERLVDESPGPVYIFYREIQSEKINDQTITNDEKVVNFRRVIDGFDKQSGKNDFDELKLNKNAKLLLPELFNSYPDRNEMAATLLLNNFCENLHTSARSEGKYAILILMGDSIFICHADSKELTITKNAKVIERLLDTDNVDKYAEFRKMEEDRIVVRHYERYRTESLSGWLGVSPHKIAYGDAGGIKIFTEIDDATCAFQFEQEQFEQEFLIDEKYQIVEDILRTPNGNEYSIQQVKYGKQTFHNPDVFKEEFHSIYYDVKSYQSHYSKIGNSLDPFVKTIYDSKNEVTEGRHGKSLVQKTHNEFDVVFADSNIQLSADWKIDLIKKFDKNTRIRIFHAGHPFSDEPTVIGPLEIYNELELELSDHLSKLYSVIPDAGTGSKLSIIISYTIFTVLQDWIDSPLQNFFRQLAQKYANRLDANGVILRDEDSLLEFKDRDWFAVDDDAVLAEKFTHEIQGETRLIIGGIDEDKQRIKPIDKSRFSPERNHEIQSKVKEMNGTHDEIQIKPMPLSNGDCIIFAFTIKEDNGDVFKLLS